EKAVAATFTGDGSTSEGDFHEAVNLAAVWKLPVLFVVENNQYGLSTPTSEQYACKDIADKAQGYGISGRVVDGNDLFAVMDAVSDAPQRGGGGRRAAAAGGGGRAPCARGGRGRPPPPPPRGGAPPRRSSSS